MKKDCILVLDFGSQYTQLIARRLREQGVYAEILPFNTSLETIRSKAPKGIVLSGGPASVYEKDAYFCDEGVFALGVPVLGVCYGMQLMAQHFGGIVERSQAQEFGKAKLLIVQEPFKSGNSNVDIRNIDYTKTPLTLAINKESVVVSKYEQSFNISAKGIDVDNIQANGALCQHFEHKRQQQDNSR